MGFHVGFFGCLYFIGWFGFSGCFLVGCLVFCLLVCLPLEASQVKTIVGWWNICSAGSSLKVRVQLCAFSISQLCFVCLCIRLFLLWQCLIGCGWIPQSSGMSSVTSCNFNCCALSCQITIPEVCKLFYIPSCKHVFACWLAVRIAVPLQVAEKAFDWFILAVWYSLLCLRDLLKSGGDVERLALLKNFWNKSSTCYVLWGCLEKLKLIVS